MELVEVASGWRLQVRADFSGRLSKLWQERPSRYSRALLETLALIAYRQPITRAEIEDVRGVTVNPNIVRTLTERGWIRVVGHREVPGHPELLGTTREFLDYFGLKSLDELPSLAALKDMDDVGIQLEFAGPGDGAGSGRGHDCRQRPRSRELSRRGAATPAHLHARTHPEIACRARCRLTPPGGSLDRRPTHHRQREARVPWPTSRFPR